MEFNELIQARYSCRKYRDQEVEQEKLERILDAGRLAPTGGNEQPQRILVVKSKEARKSLDECTKYAFEAPVVLICCYDREHTAKNLITNRSCGHEDIAIVMTHMMLASFNEGLACIWIAYLDPEKLRQHFRIPETYEIIGLLPLGYAADDATPSPWHARRHPLNETVAYDSY